MNRIFYIIISLLLYPFTLHGQAGGQERFIQVSGIITDISNIPVSGVTVISKKLRRGTISERTGIYSITSIPGDTIFYRALGFKRYHTVIPPEYDSRHCMVDIKLELDTIPIGEVTILPWKTYNEFIKEMTREKPPDPLIEYMNENIASIYVAVSNQTGVSISPEAGYRYAMEQNFSALATRGQFPVNNLMNPFAWAKFINGLKNGLLKNEPVRKPQSSKPVRIKKKTESE